MKIADHRLFPHPVIRNGNQNFSSSKFEVNTEYRHNNNEYEFHLNVFMNEQNLTRLLKKSEVSILCHLECSKTKFRSVEKLKIGENNFKLNVGSVDGRLQLVALIIAKKEINEYYSKDFHPDYEKASFSIQKGNILGIADIPSVFIENKKENNSKVPSIFDISYDEKSDLMNLVLTGNRITIIMPKIDYMIRNSHKGNLKIRTIMNSMIVFPALMGVLNELAHKDSVEEYGNCRWFVVINKKLKELGYDLENNVLEDANIFEIAQELLDRLFSEAINSLSFLEESEE